MLIRLVRLTKRLLVLALGIGIVYFAVWEIFPFLDNQVPWAIALLATYIFTAYVLIPLITRGWRLIFQPSHIPLYCVTPDGFASDPINIGIIGTKKEIMLAMEKAGWYQADKRTIKTIIKMGRAMLNRQSYPTAPFSNLYLFGRKQDIGFQKPIEKNPSYRHHVRFWACHLEGPEAFHKDVHFWQRFHRPSRDNSGRQLWVGAASKDVGIMPIRHNAQLTHMIDPDTNTERDLIVQDLRASHTVQKTLTERITESYTLRNRTLGGILHTDGKIRICILKP